MNETPPIIHLVDDDKSILTSFCRLLETAGHQVCCYENAGEFLMQADLKSHGCLVLDLRMPGPDGFDLQDSLKRKNCQLPIVFITGHGDIPMSVRAMKEGASDFLTKPVSRDVLLNAVKQALEKDRQNQLLLLKYDFLRKQYHSLTPREKTILHRVVDGALNKEIAFELDLSERTVKTHRAQIMEKFSVSTLVDLVRIADELKRSGVVV